MMPKSTGVICGDLTDNLLLYSDDYTFYQASPSLELARDAVICPAMSYTPDRSTRLLWPGTPACGDAYLITNTPRSLVTPSFPTTNTVFSPSPLSLSRVPSLVYPEISPPSQGSGTTPFEQQFVGGFSREWNSLNTQISPVARKNTHSLFSPSCSNAGGTPSRTNYGSISQDSQDAIGRVSLIDKFISAAADETATTGNDVPLSTFPSQNRSSTPLSDLSDLTSLSSPESFDRFGRGRDLRSGSPPTSPIVERPKKLRRPKTQYIPSSEREPSPNHSTRSSPRSRDPDYLPAKGTTGSKRKRTPRSCDGDEIPSKRKKTWSSNTPEQISTDTQSALGKLTRRKLPTDIPYHSQFSLLYLRFPVSSYLRLANGTFPLLSSDSKCVAGVFNEPRDALDLYTPRFVKGSGTTKVGVCPICIENPSRGGKGEVVWLSTKFSAYKWQSRIFRLVCTESEVCPVTTYRISSVSARPFSPPVAFRTVERHNAAKNERPTIQEGKCHKCKKWVYVESVKNMDIKVKELYWWKHAAACHQGNNIQGDDDFFLDDDIYRRVQQYSDHDP